MNLYDQIKLLRDCELYTDLNSLVSVTLTLADNGDTSLTNSQKYQAMIYHGDALYHTDQHRKAEDIYRKSLQLKKTLNKVKGKSASAQSIADMTSDVEVKYKIHLCKVHLKQYKAAMNALETISTKHRTPKINLALAKLYHRTGMDRSAITCFKEVVSNRTPQINLALAKLIWPLHCLATTYQPLQYLLQISVRECPLALDAIKSLLMLGMKGAEVSALVINSVPQGPQYEWLMTWIKGHALLSVQEYNSAKATFKHLDTKTCLKDNIDLLCSTGECCFNNGDYTQALLTLQQAHTLDPFSLTNMDMCAYLLSREKKLTELESLYNQLMSVTENAPEPWIAIGYFCMATLRPTKAVYFSQRALTIEPTSVFGLLLKGSALLQLKTPDAVFHFREALRLAPNSFEAHCGVIESYISTHRMREAAAVASKAIKTLGSNARTLTLCATVLAKVPCNVSKAKIYLEKVMKLDSTLLEPVYLLADIYTQEQQYERGINLLRGQLQHHNTCKLHQMLADLLVRNNEHQEALDQYNIALKIDPSNTLAREGMENVEKRGDVGYSEAAEVDVDASENEVDLDGSESGWSENDFT